MAINSPILVTGPPRCGTTMLTALIKLHGYWVGKTGVTRFPSTNSNIGTENKDIKEMFKTEGNFLNWHNWEKKLPEDTFSTYDALFTKLQRIVPEDTNWVLKTTWVAVFYKFWSNTFPNAKWILPKRELKFIVDSMNRHPGMRRHSEKKKLLFTKALITRQDEIKELVGEKNCLEVDVTKIANKDIEELNKFFGFLGVNYNERIVFDFLKPKMMKQ